MPTERVPIDAFLKTAATALLLDVRSPGEYDHAHMPGAVSLPLFTNEERAIVGTAYKQQSREQAIKIGLDLFGPKMRRMVEEVEGIYDLRFKNYDLDRPKETVKHNAKIVCLYCWRGGMRSAAVAWLLSLYGFQVCLLQGGYKSFRTWVFEKVAASYNFNVIGGYTGSGKTGLLYELEQRGEKIIDLEKLASHKGSAFGNIGLPAQPSQEMFENKLALALHSKTHVQNMEEENTPVNPTNPQICGSNFFKTPYPIWIEDESQRIGTINLPNAFWQTMRNAPIYFLDIPFEPRLQHLVTEYGTLDTTQMIDAIRRIAKRLGPMETKNAIRFLEEANTAESFRILLQYYDKQYRKALHNRQNLTTLLHQIRCETVCAGNAQLLSKPISA